MRSTVIFRSIIVAWLAVLSAYLVAQKTLVTQPNSDAQSEIKSLRDRADAAEKRTLDLGLLIIKVREEGIADLEFCSKNMKAIDELRGKMVKQGEAVRATEFNVIDSEGRILSVLNANGLALFKGANPMAILGTDWLTFYDSNGPRTSLQGAAHGGPRLEMYDNKKQLRNSLGVDEDGASLTLYDEKGKTRANIGVSVTGDINGRRVTYPESTIILFNADEKVRWVSP